MSPPPHTDKLWPIRCDPVTRGLESHSNYFYRQRTKICDFTHFLVKTVGILVKKYQKNAQNRTLRNFNGRFFYWKLTKSADLWPRGGGRLVPKSSLIFFNRQRTKIRDFILKKVLQPPAN